MTEPKDGMIEPKDVWLGLVQGINSTEAISWNRLYNFLMGNSILVLGWATIYASTNHHSNMARIVMSGICVMGGISGPLWADLGRRTREHLERELKQATKIEKSRYWPDDLPKPVSDGEPTRAGASRYSSNKFLLQAAPYGFTALYVLLLVATW